MSRVFALWSLNVASLIAAFSVVALPTSACIGDKFDSVHFNSGEPDFGELPRRANMYYEYSNRVMKTTRGNGEGRTPPTELEPGVITPARVRATRHTDNARARARADEAGGKWAAARREYVDIAANDGWTGDLRDRVAVLDMATTDSSLPADLVRRYLWAMERVRASYAKDWGRAKTEFEQIAGDAKAGALKSFAQYQIGALYAGWFDYPKAIAVYQEVLRDAPHFTRREDVLIMTARAAILPETAETRRPEIGTAALHQPLTEFPRTRFRPAATGLQARLDLLGGDYGDAITKYLAVGDTESVELTLRQLPESRRQHVYPRLLCDYLRKLDRTETYESYTLCVARIRQTMELLTSDGAVAFHDLLRADPSHLAPPYLYYRLYHCTNSPGDLSHLLNLARAVGADNAALPPLVRVRMAELFYASGQTAEALRWARMANSAPEYAVQPFDRALYVMGAALNRQGKTKAARRIFESLLARCSDSSLRMPTRENLAILYEKQGEFGRALDQYFALGYSSDIAYMLDVRMTTAQVAAYAALRASARSKNPRRDLIVYSLGMRYMRDENWAAARRGLESLPKRYYTDAYQGPSDSDKIGGRGWSWNDEAQPPPLQTIAELARLKRRALNAKTDAARASALFHYADYYYDHGTLLLYNGPLWKGEREFNFDFFWNGRVATRDDARAVHAHMYQHETYARTKAICEMIARDYPDTPTAPYALYRAGCCASKLAHFNGWWREDADKKNLYGQASHLMKRIGKRYPRCPLAAEARKFARVFGNDAGASDTSDESSEANPYGRNEDL